ncbi:ABC transporter permease [Exiguobacterium sp. A1_3_1]|uniref:ABC transporter permease n=1 Tax=Exiguobacterium TaxID=33986 RepID=UPI00397E0B2D
MSQQIKLVWSQAFTVKRCVLYLLIILGLPVLQFSFIYEGYQFFLPIEVFEETLSGMIPMLFPVLAVLIFLPIFIAEYKDNYLTYVRTRASLKDYLLAVGFVNATLTGLVFFLMTIVTFVLIHYVEPIIGLVNYWSLSEKTYETSNAFSFLADIHPLLYAVLYAAWIGLNGAAYATLAYLLILVLEQVYLAISLPFVAYHIFNFVAGIMQAPQFSPISTVFPFNITEQPLWTVFVPFAILVVVNITLYLTMIRPKPEWIFQS